MNCTECLDDLVAYLEELLSPEGQAGIQVHLETCERCRAEYEALAQLRQRLVSLRQASRGSEKKSDI